LRSSLDLPELVPVAGDADADVQIELGTVSDPGGGQEGLVSVDGALLLVVPGVARYRIENGARIVVDPLPGAPAANVRLFLFGSAFGALLHQRGLLPLHANAIEIERKAVVFMGTSGEGKSTLAAWFHDRGYRIVADDVCVVRVRTDGRVYTAPGQQRLRLWKESLVATGRDSSAYERSFAGRDDIEKFDVPLDPDRRLTEECEVACIYVLGQAETFAIHRLSGLHVVEAIFAHTYRGHYVHDAGSQRWHWDSAISLAHSIPVFRIDRPRDLALMDEQGGLILDHVASILEPPL
jgi:hypothetical protein